MTVSLNSTSDEKESSYCVRSPFSSAIKGGLSSFFSITICHPLFTLKTLKMSGLKISLKPKFLYAGYKSNAICDITNQCVAFFAFSFFSKCIMNNKPLSDQERVLGGLFSGAAAAPLLSMFERAMIVQQVKKNREFAPASSKATMFGVFTSIVKNEGKKGLFRGLYPTIFRESFNSCCFFGLSKILAHETNKYIDNESVAEGISYFSSGMIAGVITTPFDVLKTSMQNEIGDTRPISAVCSDLGVKNLFRGATERTATIGATMFFLGIASNKLSTLLDEQE